MSIVHSKVVNTAQVPDPTQAELNAQIALGNYPAGTVLADIALGSDFNADHVITGLVNGIVPTYDSGTLAFVDSRFLAGFNTTSPNNTVPVASFSAYDTGYANIDAAIVPKGTGAFMLRIPDGTGTGGNKRGNNAIDLQTFHGAALNVASGTRAVTIGSQNRATNNDAVAIGNSNKATGSASVAIGKTNEANSFANFSIGGFNTVDGLGYTAGALGYQNTISGGYGFAFGYYNQITLSGVLGTLIFGLQCRSTARRALVIGTGVTFGSYLSNATTNSMFFGVNTTVPSLAIWNGGGVGGFGKVSIGSATAPTDDCLFEVVSTTKGARPLPKMTTAQKSAIATPSEGMLVHDTDQKVPNVYIAAWEQIMLDTKYRQQFLLMGA